MEALFTVQNATTLGLWVVIGAAMSWGRNLRLAAIVPALVTGFPAFVIVGSGGLSFGTDAAVGELLEMIAVPVLGSVMGGYAGIAIAPQRRSRKAARVAYEQARREAERVADEIYKLREETLPVPAPIEISTPSAAHTAPVAPQPSRPVLYDVKSVRTRLAMHEDRLRAIGRTLTETG